MCDDAQNTQIENDISIILRSESESEAESDESVQDEEGMDISYCLNEEKTN